MDGEVKMMPVVPNERYGEIVGDPLPPEQMKDLEPGEVKFLPIGKEIGRVGNQKEINQRLLMIFKAMNNHIAEKFGEPAVSWADLDVLGEVIENE